MDKLETKKILEENLVLNLDKNEGSKRVGDIREHLKGIRDEIEEIRRCFTESPEFITSEEYESIPKIPINLEGIDELKKRSYSETREEDYSISEVGSLKLFEVFSNCDLIEFFTSNKSEEIPVSCQARTFTDDINFFINLQQAESDKDVEIPFTEVNPTYVRFGDRSYFIQGEDLQGFTKFVLTFYKRYFKKLKEVGGDPSRVDLSEISVVEEKKPSFFDFVFMYLLSLLERKEEVCVPSEESTGGDFDYFLNADNSCFQENINEGELDCFLKNRKKIVIKKVWA
jgi:hypothetical protein